MIGRKYLQWEELHQYNMQMQHMINALRKYFSQYEIKWMQKSDIVQWLDRLSRTLNVLQCMYVYDSNDVLDLDLSGLPSRQHIDLLRLMVENLRGEKSCDIDMDIKVKKAQFVDEIFRGRQINNAILSEIAKMHGQQICLEGEIILPFRFTYLQERKCPHDDRRAFVCTWERVVDNGAIAKYVMLFEVDDQIDITYNEVLEKLKSDVRVDTTIILPLEKHARYIDIANAFIYPKWIGRLIVGPVWIGNLTSDQNIIQTAVDKSKNLLSSCALQVIYDYVFSIHEIPVGNVRDAQGTKISHIQSFASSNIKDYRERGVVRSENHIFAPHYVIRQLDVVNKKLLHAIEEV